MTTEQKSSAYTDKYRFGRKGLALLMIPSGGMPSCESKSALNSTKKKRIAITFCTRNTDLFANGHTGEVRGCGGEGHHAPRAHGLQRVAEVHVRGPKVVRPLADAVGLVDASEKDPWEGRQQTEEGRGAKFLGREEEDPYAAGLQL
jgi:hypothetical protein